MCNCERTTFIFPDGHAEPQNNYTLCKHSRDGLPCGRVQLINAGTRYVPGAQPIMSPPVSPGLQSQTDQQPEQFDVFLPSLTDGPTASTVSMPKAGRAATSGRKYLVDGAKFHFEFPFSRSKSKKKKKLKEEARRKSKSSSPETMVNAQQRRSFQPNSTYPEAPEPPAAATPLFGEIGPGQSAAHIGTASYGLPPSPPSVPGLYNPPLSSRRFSPPTNYPPALDPRFQRPAIYEERIPPSLRGPVANPNRTYHTRETPSPSAGRPNATHINPTLSHANVVFDPEPQLPLRQQPIQQPIVAPPTNEAPVTSQAEGNAEIRRYQLREEARERARQERKIADLEVQLELANEELANAQAREAEVEAVAAEREQQRQRASPNLGTARTMSFGEQQSRPRRNPNSSPSNLPQRTYSQRTVPALSQRTDARQARNTEPGPYRDPSPPIRRYDSNQTAYGRDADPESQSANRPTPPLRRQSTRTAQPEQRTQTPQGEGRGGIGSSSEVQSRIARLESDIRALRRARHNVEDDFVRQLDADSRAEALERERELPRLRAYERLVGTDRGRERERERERRRSLRHSRHGSEDLRRSFERVHINRGQGGNERGSGERPWSWDRERERRGY